MQYIDSHQHFWQVARGDYGWLTPELEVLYRDFLPRDMQPLLAQSQIAKTVLVQAAPTVAETEYLLALAEQHPFIAAVVGWVDMQASDAVEQLQQLASNPYLKSIRPMIQDIEDPQWMLKAELAPVFEYLCQQQLAFDALVKPQHLPHLYSLLQRYPELRVVIDHAAKPDIAAHQFTDWARWMQKLAADSQAYCKISGLLTEAGPGAGYHELKIYVEHLLKHFGCERLMWGSDWPVLNLASDYPSWMQITQRFCSQLSESQQQALMAGTASRFYQL